MGQQLSLLDALERGHLAAEACAEKAGAVWVHETVCALQQRLQSTLGEQAFTVEELRERLQTPTPHDLRAWGHVTRECVRRGLIQRIPNAYRATKSSNGSPKPLYRRGPCS